MGFYQDHLRQLPTGVWYIPSKAQAANPVPITEERNIAICGIVNAYRYVFCPVDASGSVVGTEFVEDICKDYAAPVGDFLPGIILNRLIHTVESDCWSLSPDKHAGYYARYDSSKKPLFAKVTHGK